VPHCQRRHYLWPQITWPPEIVYCCSPTALAAARDVTNRPAGRWAVPLSSVTHSPRTPHSRPWTCGFLRPFSHCPYATNVGWASAHYHLLPNSELTRSTANSGALAMLTDCAVTLLCKWGHVCFVISDPHSIESNVKPRNCVSCPFVSHMPCGCTNYCRASRAKPIGGWVVKECRWSWGAGGGNGI
jgi:hypothetical protein